MRTMSQNRATRGCLLAFCLHACDVRWYLLHLACTNSGPRTTHARNALWYFDALSVGRKDEEETTQRLLFLARPRGGEQIVEVALGDVEIAKLVNHEVVQVAGERRCRRRLNASHQFFVSVHARSTTNSGKRKDTHQQAWQRNPNGQSLLATCVIIRLIAVVVEKRWTQSEFDCGGRTVGKTAPE